MAIKNERGGALIFVVLIIAVFTILGFTLVKMNTSRSNQVEMSEKNILSTNMAEMGMKNAEELVRDTIRKTPYSNSTELGAEIRKNIKEGTIYSVEDNYSFSYKIDDINTSDPNVLSLSLIATGKYSNKTRDIHTKFEITKSPATSLFPESTGTVEGDTEIKGKGNNKSITWPTTTYVDGYLYLFPPSELIVNGDFYVTGELKLEANSNLLVNGDAYLKQDPSVKQNNTNKGNLGFFCTEGTLYLYGSSNDVTLLKDKETCSALNNGKPINSIYARQLVIVQSEHEQSFWKEDNLTITSEYK